MKQCESCLAWRASSLGPSSFKQHHNKDSTTTTTTHHKKTHPRLGRYLHKYLRAFTLTHTQRSVRTTSHHITSHDHMAPTNLEDDGGDGSLAPPSSSSFLTVCDRGTVADSLLPSQLSNSDQVPLPRPRAIDDPAQPCSPDCMCCGPLPSPF